jgi:predicted ATP-dependent protease
VCQTKGLIGEQGVSIPHQNVNDLMLKPEKEFYAGGREDGVKINI